MPRKKILAVDDEPNIVRQIAQHLNRFGFEVKTATSVVTALDCIGWRDSPDGALKWRPDVIISDWKMDGYNGLELLYIVRSDAALRSVPFILMAEARNPLYDSQGFLRTLAQQPDAFLFKPFLPSEMIAQINRLTSTDTAQ